MLRHCNAFKAFKVLFRHQCFLEMRSCYDQMSSHNFAMSRTPPLSQSLSHGYGSKQRRECRTADTLSTELSQHLQFLQWFIKQQGCGFVSEAKARIGGSVSAARGQASSGAGRMLAVWQRSADTDTGPRTVKHEA